MPLALTLDLITGTSDTNRDAFYARLEEKGWIKYPDLTTFWTHPSHTLPEPAAATVRLCALGISDNTTVAIKKAVIMDYGRLVPLSSTTAT